MSDAIGVGLESVASASRVERVEDDDQPIVVSQTLAMPHRRRGDPFGLAVVHARTDVERIVVIKQVHFSDFGRLGAVAWTNLVEIVDDFGRVPDRIVQPPVNYGRCVDTHDAHDLGGIIVDGWVLRRNGA